MRCRSRSCAGALCPAAVTVRPARASRRLFLHRPKQCCATLQHGGARPSQAKQGRAGQGRAGQGRQRMLGPHNIQQDECTQQQTGAPNTAVPVNNMLCQVQLPRTLRPLCLAPLLASRVRPAAAAAAAAATPASAHIRTSYHYTTTQPPHRTPIQKCTRNNTDSKTNASALQYEQQLTDQLLAAERRAAGRTTTQPAGTEFNYTNNDNNILETLQQQHYCKVKQQPHLHRLLDCNQSVMELVCSTLATSPYRTSLYHAGLRIRRCKTSVDMTCCTVYWCVYDAVHNTTVQYNQLNTQSRRLIEALLQKTIGRIRHAISESSLKLRVIPSIQYSYDSLYDAAVRKQSDVSHVQRTITRLSYPTI